MAGFTRRGLLLGGVACGLGVGLGTAGVMVHGGGAPGFVEAVVRRSFPSLRMAPEDMAAFADAFLKRRDEVGYLVAVAPRDAGSLRRRLRRWATREKLWRRVYLSEPVRARLPAAWRAALMETERDIVTLFALSTDVFARGAVDDPVTYVGYADPFEQGCIANPFATFDLDEPTSNDA